ncbi:MBL fold metallo-hydrolase [Geodermatophilus sabuli]|uniref:L-ascorbate metabolism protein UlaG, beta-lactamase superfamily n=1 Tax=Geodermatophilus sabuli TaxID=1564158 RepID=A0A285EHG8_9ACTN|nr:MBL fold metallo-hydrolase [Geodermatophilus sabuli]MBB3086324.1 L-ascorbate metabolism protein UlaG (beta-lactamase superfamily) [Geodermatophilus sabuli]SNX97461.1 L-ascorbate metabolism protein UlaG, beta-lactamase superfamily [Geodermatophilus sabuli]
MELTKHGHACVVLSEGDRRVVIDPGAFTDPAVLDGASAVLVTHEHFDHFSPDVIRSAMDADPGLELWTNRSVAGQLEGLGSRVHVVGDGDAVTVAGFDVTVHGELHAVIHPDIPRILNVGFLVGGQVFHPGDALTVPGEPVSTLLLPVHAPWSKVSEVIDYVRAVDADQAFAVHDGLLNDTGLGVIGGMLGERGPGTPTPYSRLAPGDSVDL